MGWEQAVRPGNELCHEVKEGGEAPCPLKGQELPLWLRGPVVRQLQLILGQVENQRAEGISVTSSILLSLFAIIVSLIQ